MNDNGLPQWTSQAKHLLDESVQALDGTTASRLNRARQAALAQRPTRRRAIGFYVPAGLAAACALLLAVGVWQGRFAPAASSVPTPVAAGTDAGALRAADLDLLASGDNLDMMQDLDFYTWLEAQDQGDNG
jgi:type VI protein secretion system component VasF